MKLGVFITLFNDRSLEDTLSLMSNYGVETVEVGSGGFPGKSHLNPDYLLANPGHLEYTKNLFRSHNINISALSCHSNPVHPNKEIADKARYDFEQSVRLAQQMEVDTIVCFSGCPGDGSSQHSNWITSSWPYEFRDILNYQWNEILIPYWREATAFANYHGIHRIAIEMHPGFCVYNPGTLLRLREAVGNTIGANLDPSHLFWQGMDPVKIIHFLGESIYHFHAKDTQISTTNCPINGVLDPMNYDQINKRSWIFRTVGYGQDAKVWKDMIAALKMVGYDRSISIEHEDPLMDMEEGLQKAIVFLSGIK